MAIYSHPLQSNASVKLTLVKPLLFVNILINARETSAVCQLLSEIGIADILTTPSYRVGSSQPSVEYMRTPGQIMSLTSQLAFVSKRFFIALLKTIVYNEFY